ncbi:MAG: PEP-CTERM sorting domain-containing protein [Verrucomicrobia bacterium]|nr:PEP-CTERM sorting domain-containing protein [Verrucomicrobiota bacterium]
MKSNPIRRGLPPFLPLSDLPNNVLRDAPQKANSSNLCLVVAAMLLLPVVSAQAAVIFSETIMDTTASATGSEIQSDGTVVTAIYYGGDAQDWGWGAGGGPASIAVQGITFNTGTASGAVTDPRLTNSTTPTPTSIIAGIFGPIGGPTDYQALTRTNATAAGGGAWLPTLTIDGLTAGQDYRLQWVDRTPGTIGGTVTAEGTEYTLTSGGAGHLLTIEWTAEDDTLNVDFGQKHDIGGYVLHQVIPEPSTVLLGGLGAVALLRRRRRA